MSLEDSNKAIMQRFIETWNQGDMEGLESFWASNIVHYTRAGHGKQDILRSYGITMRAFPDLQWEIGDIIAQGDKVVLRLTGRATHTGPFLEILPTGKRVEFRSVDICRLADGKIVEHWGLLDELALLEQLDLIPSEYLTAM